jgi:hypothetical protein
MSLARRIGVGLLSLALVPAPSLHAQAGRPSQEISPFTTVFFTTGTLLVDVTKLNPHFERTDIGDPTKRPGYFTISNDAFAVGLGGYGAVLDRFVLGGEFLYGDVGQESSPSGKTNALTTSYIVATAGYAVFTSWRLNVVPSLGLGFGTLNLTLKDRNGGAGISATQDPDFDEIIAKPGASSVIKGSYFVMQPSIAADFLVLRSTESRLGLTLGVHFSSPISPNRTKWTYQGRDVFNGPDVGPSGGSLRLVAGVGGFRLR